MAIRIGARGDHTIQTESGQAAPCVRFEILERREVHIAWIRERAVPHERRPHRAHEPP
jgi:hypothetical protein